MRLNYLANAIGLILKYIGFVILTPIIIAVIYKDYISILPFLTAGTFSILAGISLRKVVKNASLVENLNDIKKSEALLIVTMSWVLFGVISALPFLFYGLNPIAKNFFLLEITYSVVRRIRNNSIVYCYFTAICSCRQTNVLCRSPRSNRR